MTTVTGDTSLALAVADEYVDAARRVTLSPLTSPGRELREDPFNLGSFFPSRPGSPPVEPLSWLSPTEETLQEEEEEEVAQEADERKAELRGDGVPPARSYSLTALDDYAKEVIAKEDRLGILSLSELTYGSLLLAGGLVPLPINIHSFSFILQYVYRRSSRASSRPSTTRRTRTRMMYP